MIRAAILSVAFLAAPASATPFYSAEPATAPTQERVIARDNVWTCGGATCVSRRTGSRPAVVCATLARQVGVLRSFAVEGRAFEAAELETCNSRAR